MARFGWALSLVFLLVASVFGACPDTSGAQLWSNLYSGATSGQNITVSGTVLLDVSPSVVLGYIWVSGTLYVKNVDLELRVQGLKVNTGGSLIAGSSDCPITNKVVFTFFGSSDYAGQDAMGSETNNDTPDSSAVVSKFGSKGLIVATGGNLVLYGEVKGPSWTNLASTASKGATTLTLQKAVQWNAGDSIIVASTDFGHVYDNNKFGSNPVYKDAVGYNFPDQSERKTIASVSGDGLTVTLTSPLVYTHWGAGKQFAEVGLLTRKIVLQSDPASSDINGYGGHFLMRKGNRIELSGLEVTKMGQRGVLARYPVHFHNMRFVLDTQPFIRDSSIHDNYQRCLVVHESHGVTIKNNVAYNTSGHCYFLEDGGENQNVFDGNLGVSVTPFNLIPSDSKASIFWIVNPNNTWINNAAVGGHFGYWFGMPEVPMAIGGRYWPKLTPRTLPLIKWDNNVAHSSRQSGVQIDEMQKPDGTTEQGNWTPLGPSGEVLDIVLTKTLSYKNREFGIWGHSSLHFSNCVLQDNARGFMINGESVLQDSLITGETDNIGNPVSIYNAQALPRTYPNRWGGSNDLLGGHSSYDNGGPQISFRNTFENFVSTEKRPAGAFIALPFGPFKLYPRNHFGHQITFNNANPFWIDYNSVDVHYGWNVLDADGSATGVKGGAWIQSNETIFNREGCVWKPEWNANLCPTFAEGMVQFMLTAGAAPGAATGGSPLPKTDARVVRGAVRPLGSVAATGPVGKMTSPRDSSYQLMHNLIARRSYSLEFYMEDGSPALTPATFTINVPSSEPGDWVVFAVPYPSGTTFTLTPPSWDTRKFTQVTSWANLAPFKYLYDQSSNHLYFLIQNSATSGHENVFGFGSPTNSWYPITVTANCNGVCQPPLRGVPPAFDLPQGTKSESYLAQLDRCQSSNTAPASLNSGKAFFHLFPQGFSGQVELHFKIFHDISGPNNRITIKEGAIGANGAAVIGQKVEISNTASSGLWYLTRYQWEKLASGNLYVSVEDNTGVEILRGQIQCANGGCSKPPATAASLEDVCNPTYGRLTFYNDTFVKPASTSSWSNLAVFNPSYTGDVLCGTNSLRMTAPTGAVGINWWGSAKDLVLDPKYVSLEFFAKAAPGVGKGLLRLYATTNVSNTEGTPNGVVTLPSEVDNFLVDEVTWTRIRISKERLGLTGIKGLIKTVLFRFEGYPDNGIDIFIDEFRWITEPAGAIAALANVNVPKFAPVCTNPTAPPSNTFDDYGSFPPLRQGSASRVGASILALVVAFSLFV